MLEDSIPGAVLVVVDDCSHALLMEKPHEVERHVQAWLDEQAAAAPPAPRLPEPDRVG